MELSMEKKEDTHKITCPQIIKFSYIHTYMSHMWDETCKKNDENDFHFK